MKWPLHKHRWEEFSDGFKRRCKCGAEEWLFSKSYPAIGEAKYTWGDMTLWKPNWLERLLERLLGK